MDDSTLAALNSAASTLTQAAGVVNGAGADKRQRAWMERQYKQQREWQLQDRREARNYALDVWNMENDYKRPVAQMQRLTSAGINPNNAAASIAGVSSSAAAPQPLYQPLPNMPTPYIPKDADIMNQAAVNLSQLANLNAQTSKMKAETSKIEAETQKTFVDTDTVRQQLKASLYEFEHLLPERVRELRSIIDKNLSERRFNDAEIEQVDELTKRTAKEVDRIDYEIERLQSEIRLNREKVRSEAVSQDKDKAEAALAESSSKLNDSKKQAQDLLNGYEKELQTFGTSISAAKNPVINAKDQAAVMTGRAVKNAPKNKNKRVHRVSETTFRSMAKPFSTDWRDELGH